MPRTALRSRLAVLGLLCMTLPCVRSIPVSAQDANHVVPRTLWKTRYDGPGNNTDGATAMGVSPDGSSVFVTGYSIDPNTFYDYATVAYGADTGRRLWVARYSGAANDLANALAVSPDGATVFVTGQSFGSARRFDYVTVAYDSATGAERWVARYNGPGNGDDVPYAMAVSPDGGDVFVTGYSIGDNGFKAIATVAYDAATGKRRWVARYYGPRQGDDVAFALAVSPDGGDVFVTGYSTGSNLDYATMAYEASTGKQRWVARYKGPGNGDDGAFALGVSPDGAKVFVSGYSLGPATFNDYATIAYSARSGTRRWVARYNGTGNVDDVATALGVSPDGRRVFVTGYSLGSSTSLDYATVAYDPATGRRRWVARYNGTGNGDDSAYAIAVSPHGASVFVTGEALAGTTRSTTPRSPTRRAAESLSG